MPEDIKSTIPVEGEPDLANGSSEVKELAQLSTTFESFKVFIQEHLEKQIEQNRFKDETINRLQKSVSDHEKGLISKIKEPLIWSLIFFKDSFEKFWEKYEASSNLPVAEVDMLFEELDEIFYSNGLEKINCEPSFYDREKQIVRRKELTLNPEEDRLVVKVLKTGYLLDGKLFRKEEIVVKAFDENPER